MVRMQPPSAGTTQATRRKIQNHQKSIHAESEEASRSQIYRFDLSVLICLKTPVIPAKAEILSTYRSALGDSRFRWNDKKSVKDGF